MRLRPGSPIRSTVAYLRLLLCNSRWYHFKQSYQ
ncbi:hypothetical protein CASFOL_025651 [Castilleja foliolosa]|uniref:Uncharacterized protein n=1 Tax=Castilleja foliolosa TaxID=1961234 RepID=A0ABD3CSQ7_9LAMI